MYTHTQQTHINTGQLPFFKESWYLGRPFRVPKLFLTKTHSHSEITQVNLSHFLSSFAVLAAPGPLRPQRPRIITAPQNSSVPLHQTAILECMATGHPKPIISWSRADSKSIDVYNTQVLGNGNLIITDIQRKHGGIYMCRATTPGTRNYTVASANVTVMGKEVPQFSCERSDCAKTVIYNNLTVVSFEAPPSLVEWPESLTRPRAGTARFVCQADGVPTPHVTWLKNGEKVKSNGRIKMYNRYLFQPCL